VSQIQFIDLQAQRAYLGGRLEAAIKTVLGHGHFIMGPEILTLEFQLAAFALQARAVTCASGTDALLLPLMAWNVGPGDAVFVPSFTFASTAEVVALLGAQPVFVDVLPDTFNIDPDRLAAAVEEVVAAGELSPRVVIAVDLFGQLADYPRLREVADRNKLKLISDAAQGFGSTLNGNQSGTWADCVATSFFPAKPLGCYGDGGAVLTNDLELAETIESLRVHGKGDDKYDNVRIGINGRMDTLQAAIVIEKLSIFPEEIQKRNLVATRYTEALRGICRTPDVGAGVVSTWAQYTLAFDDRERVQRKLKEQNIPTAIYYPKPLHQQTAYKGFLSAGGTLPVSESLSQKVLSIPMHPYLDVATQDHIVASIRNAVV